MDRGMDFDFRWSGEQQEVDRGVVGGLLLCAVLLVAGMVCGGTVGNFLSASSFLVVAGGTVGAALVNFSLYDLRYAWIAFREVLLTKEYHPSERIRYLVRLAGLVRRDGLLVLEREGKHSGDRFLKTALQLTVDAQESNEIRRILETEMRSSTEKASRAIHVFEAMGSYAPAMGLIGTLLGLINMLGALEDPATVGPSMALALNTTLYGAVMANMVFLPVAGKLRNRSEEDAVVKAITIEGVLSLGKQENSIVVEQRLQSFLPLAPAA